MFPQFGAVVVAADLGALLEERGRSGGQCIKKPFWSIIPTPPQARLQSLTVDLTQATIRRRFLGDPSLQPPRHRLAPRCRVLLIPLLFPGLLISRIRISPR